MGRGRWRGGNLKGEMGRGQREGGDGRGAKGEGEKKGQEEDAFYIYGYDLMSGWT